MATNLPRVTAKIFAENAAAQDIAQYGSVIGGSAVFTSDISQIQQLPAYTTGWRAAVISDRNYPTLPEMNGLQKTFSQQIAYTLQKGMPEWDENTTYYANTSFCQVNGIIYQSLTDDNIGNNPVTDTTNWQIFMPGADKDLSNLSSVGEKHFLNKTQVTNCILEVPQRVKYELEEGLLTVKAGTVCLVPYGTTDQSSSYPAGATFLNDNFKVVETFFIDGKFFVYAEVQSDITVGMPINVSGDATVCIRVSENALSYSFVSTNSGTDFGTNNGQFYDTSTNIISHITSGSITDGTQTNLSFPILKANISNSFTNNVLEVYNSATFCGKVILAHKGIKFLTADGINPDGSISNKTFTLDKPVMWTTESLSNSYHIYYLRSMDNGASWMPAIRSYNTQWFEQAEQPTGANWTWFNTLTKKWKTCIQNVISDCLCCPLGQGNLISGNFISVYADNSLELLKESDSSRISGFGMPSKKYIELTLGTNGATYTAPANGWFSFRSDDRTTSGSNLYIYAYNNINGMSDGTTMNSASTTQDLFFNLPVPKGQAISVYHNLPSAGSSEIRNFNFIYAQGEGIND